MFTGIIEELGEVVSIEEIGESSRIRLRGPLVSSDARHGDSIAVNGVCLTVLDSTDELADGKGEFTADVMAETLNRSSLGALGVGSRVNLERAMALGARLGGHLVQGHVDATGTLLGRAPGDLDAAGKPRWEVLRFSLPPSISRYLVEKGSITVDGVSLTVVDAAADSFSVSLIPATLALTTLGAKQLGDPVNLEVDVLAKYVERLLAAGTIPAEIAQPTPAEAAQGGAQ
ncbi:Riboflavin synthase subunit alpha [Kitasatospora sp. MMS16-BH015]|uniref:riboflavin synthase n=1 Tax=Kitasatospora sp. MMS16-BH015 TaxID=2018025 RepID=UPI000CA335ED|nr:riboflavin synthase [Kitasatospora sp. MMS16-BH015]AUG75654.1 Riboflavin synthase subunit alpha [Kitasatospora sp. MMS16-BH015]